MIVFYSDDYVACRHAFDTTRKSARIAESLRLRPIQNVIIKAPEPLTEMQLQLAHSQAYIHAVRLMQSRPALAGIIRQGRAIFQVWPVPAIVFR